MKVLLTAQKNNKVNLIEKMKSFDGAKFLASDGETIEAEVENWEDASKLYDYLDGRNTLVSIVRKKHELS